jgi:hypothetical protein
VDRSKKSLLTQEPHLSGVCPLHHSQCPPRPFSMEYISILLFALALALAFCLDGFGGHQHLEALKDDHADGELHKNHAISASCK